MSSSPVTISHLAIAEILKGEEMMRLTEDAANRIAEAVRSQGITVGDRDGGPAEIDLPVTVTMVTTDRAHAIVLLAHPAGIAVQAKHGALTKGASAIGIKVRGG